MCLDTLSNLVTFIGQLFLKKWSRRVTMTESRFHPDQAKSAGDLRSHKRRNVLEEDGLFSRVENSFWRKSRNSEDRLERASGSGNARVTHLVRDRCEVCVGHPLPSHWIRPCISTPHTSARPCTGRWLLLSSKSVTSKITSHWSLDSSELTVP